MAFDSKSALNHAIRYLADTAIKRNAGGWIPPKEEERQRKEQIRQELQQQRNAERQAKEQKREHEKSQKLLSKQFPTHYMPEVGRQVMMAGGSPKTDKSVSAFHMTYEPFKEYDWSRLGSSTEANQTDPDDPWAMNLAKIGPWAHENPLDKKIGGSSLPVKIHGKPKNFKSLDHLEKAVRKFASPEAFRQFLLDEGYGHIAVNDEEMGGKSYVGLSPETFKISGHADGGNVGRQVMAKGGKTKYKTWHDVPVIDPQMLVGKKVFPIFADLTKAGDNFTGIDSVQIAHPEKLMGGPGYPLLPESQKHGLAWAVEGKGRGSAKIRKDADYVVVSAMEPFSHQSNATFANALTKNMLAYTNNGRINQENLAKLNDMVRKPSEQKELQGLQGFPGFEHPDAENFIRNASFEQRSRIADILGSREAQDMGAPNMEKLTRATLDPEFAGVPSRHGLFLLEIPKGTEEEQLVHLKSKKLPEHPSYQYGIKGRIVGRFAHPVAPEILFKDWFDQKSQEEKQTKTGRTNLRRAFDLAMPVTTISQEVADMLPKEKKEIQSGKSARLALNAFNDKWEDTDTQKNQGGLGHAQFSHALKNSDASSTLSLYTPEELKNMSKEGKFTGYKLKDGEVYFGLKRGTNYAEEYGFDHPELTPNETALVSVVNNEPGARGIGGEPVVLKAIQHGATALDAFAVPTDKHPNGFLPDFYSRFGFKELGRIPFDPKYVTKDQFDDMKYQWAKTGWDENKHGLPSIAIMKWMGKDEDRSDAVRRFVTQGSESARAGSDPVNVGRAARASEQGSGSGIGAPQGERQLGDFGRDSGPVRIDNAARPANRFSRTLAATAQLSPVEAQHFGLSPEDILGAKSALGYADGGEVYEPHQRAEEQGYSIRGFHVTRGDRAQQISSAERFDPYKSALPGEEATFFWDNPDAANQWITASSGIETFDPERMSSRDVDKAERHASTIMPVRIHPGKTSTIDWQEATGRLDYDHQKMKQIIGVARKMGFDTLRIKNMHEYKMGEPHDQIAVINPHVIRSEFAEFNPSRRGEENLGAARGGAIDRDELQKAEQAGRRGDTMLAHINPQEAEMLKRMGGSGTINPRTGLPEFAGADPSGSSVTSSNYSGGASTSSYTGGSDIGGYSGSGNTTYGGGGGGGGSTISVGGGGSGSGGGGGGGGGGSSIGTIGLGSVDAFGAPQAMKTFGSIDPGQESDKAIAQILASGMKPGGDIGSTFVREAISPDLSGGNSPFAAGISSYDRSALDAQMDRMRANQQAERDESYERSVIGPITKQINVPNAGDLYGATNAPLALQPPSGMFGEPTNVTSQFGMGTRQAGFPTQQTGPMDPSQRGFAEQMAKSARESWLAANTEPESPRLGDLATPTPNRPFATQDRAGSVGSMPIGTTPYTADLTPLSSQPARPITPTPFSTFPQDVQKQMIPNRPDSSYGQTLIDPTGKYTQQALEKMKVAEDAVTMLNSPTLAGSLFRAFTPTPTPATPKQQAAIERMYKGAYGDQGASSTSSVRSNFNQAFADARARGDATFSWTNPATGKTGQYTTQLARKEGGRVPSLKNPEDWIATVSKPNEVRKVAKAKQYKPQKPRSTAIVERAIMLSSRKS